MAANRSAAPPPAAAAAPEPAPGADFLLRRLARAQAVPEGERSPEVQAFIDGVALLRQIPALLPRTAGGRPLLSVESEEGEQRALQAFLHWIAADAASPEPPACDVDVTKHLIDYLNAMCLARLRGWRPRRPVLTDALAGCCTSMLEGRPDALLEAVGRHTAVLRLLTQPGSAADAARQLADVTAAAAAGQHPPAAALPSLEQLQFVSHHGIVKTGAMLLRFGGAPPPSPRGASASGR